MNPFEEKRAPIAIVIVLIVAISALRLVVDQPGPLILIPLLLAGLWLGRWAGLAAGVACAALVTATSHLGGPQSGGVAATLIRLGIYGGVGWVVGALAESQLRLAGELRERDLKLEELRTVQQALAPSRPPRRPALDLATCYVPAEHGVAGDFYIVAPAPEGATLVAVGDVAGRGLVAAKRAWYVRTLIASSADFSDDPSTMLEAVNRALVEDAGFEAPFVTVASALVYPDGRVDWALAGHDQPLRLDSGQPLSGNGASGLPLGVSDMLGCETSTAQLDPGSGILLYTDGLTEARRVFNGAGPRNGLELFGEERVSRIVAQLNGSPSDAVIRRMQTEVSDFAGGRLADDLCLVAARLR